MNELEIWQLHHSDILTQGRQQMLQEDYVSLCTLGLGGDYTFRVKGFRGWLCGPAGGFFCFQQKISVKHRAFCQASIWSQQEMPLPRDILPTALSGVAFIIIIAGDQIALSAATPCSLSTGAEPAQRSSTCSLDCYWWGGKLSASAKTGWNGHFVPAWCFRNALAKATSIWLAYKTWQGRESCPKMQRKPSWHPHWTHWQARDDLSFNEVLKRSCLLLLPVLHDCEFICFVYWRVKAKKALLEWEFPDPQDLGIQTVTPAPLKSSPENICNYQWNSSTDTGTAGCQLRTTVLRSHWSPLWPQPGPVQAGGATPGSGGVWSWTIWTGKSIHQHRHGPSHTCS